MTKSKMGFLDGLEAGTDGGRERTLVKNDLTRPTFSVALNPTILGAT